MNKTIINSLFIVVLIVFFFIGFAGMMNETDGYSFYEQKREQALNSMDVISLDVLFLFTSLFAGVIYLAPFMIVLFLYMHWSLKAKRDKEDRGE